MMLNKFIGIDLSRFTEMSSGPKAEFLAASEFFTSNWVFKLHKCGRSSILAQTVPSDLAEKQVNKFCQNCTITTGSGTTVVVLLLLDWGFPSFFNVKVAFKHSLTFLSISSGDNLAIMRQTITRRESLNFSAPCPAAVFSTIVISCLVHGHSQKPCDLGFIFGGTP